MNTIRCIPTLSAKLVDDWTLYALCVGCKTDTERSFREVKHSIGYRQFIHQGEQAGLSEHQISDCWDLVKLNLNSIRAK